MWKLFSKPETKKSDAAGVDEDAFSPRYAGPGRIDFVKAGLSEYEGLYALIIDDIFSPVELARFLGAAEASSPTGWDVARVNATADIAYVDTSYRNGQRIIYDSEELSREIFDRIRPHLGEIEEFEEEHWARDGKMTVKKRMVRMNERLRFLRYEEGGFFGRHTDGAYFTPDDKQRTYYTVQLYLPSSSNGSAASLVPATGGSTRFHPPSRMSMGRYCDVEAVPGRVLVFQHAKLVHTGEQVLGGVKCTMRSDILYENA